MACAERPASTHQSRWRGPGHLDSNAPIADRLLGHGPVAPADPREPSPSCLTRPRRVGVTRWCMGNGCAIVRFVALTFAISWLAWSPIVAFGWSTIDDPQAAILFMLGGFGPSLAGWWMLRRAARSDTQRRLIDPRPIPGRLWLVALLGYPLVFAVSAALVVVAGCAWPAFDGAGTWVSGPVALVGGLVIVLQLGPLSEEVGWRGFAQDRFGATRRSAQPHRLGRRPPHRDARPLTHGTRGGVRGDVLRRRLHLGPYARMLRPVRRPDVEGHASHQQVERQAHLLPDDRRLHGVLEARLGQRRELLEEGCVRLREVEARLALHPPPQLG